MRTRTRKHLYIPMEIFHRELDGNLLLASTAAKNGWTVILGGKQDIFAHSSLNPKGTYMLKSIVPGEYQVPKMLRESGNVVALHDQEGMLQRAGLEYKFRFSEKTIKLTDHLFFWGEQQLSEFLEVFPNTDREKLHVSGSPRADYWSLMSFEQKRKLRNMKPETNNHQKLVLMATSFGNANHFLGRTGQKYLLKSVSKDTELTAEDENKLDENFLQRRALANVMLPVYSQILIELASNNPQLRIVVRPHPSEGEEYWRELTKGFENVIVSTEGGVTEWICDASCLIQYGSSTAIEARLLNTPVVTCIPEALPEELEKLHIGYPEIASVVTRSPTSAAKEVSRIINEGITCQDKLPIEFNRILAGLSQGNSASDRIVQTLNKTAIHSNDELRTKTFLSRILMNKHLYREYIFHYLFKIPGFEQNISAKHHHLKLSLLYRRKKIFKLKANLIKQKLNNLQLLLDTDLGDLKVREYASNCVVIEQK